MTRIALLGLFACLTSLPARAADAPAAAPLEFEAEAHKGVVAWLKDVATDLSGALRRDTPAQASLLARARDRGELMSAVLAIRKDLPEKKGAKPYARFTAVTVVATAWFGILPVGRAELMLWIGNGELRLLRFRRQPVPMRAFVERFGPRRQEGPSKALDTIVNQVLTAAAAGRCDALPLPSVADLRRATPNRSMPPQATRDAMERFAAEARGTCEAMAGMPVQRGSYALTELAGVIGVGTAPGRPFSLSLANSPEGALLLGTLTPPQ